MTNTGTEQIYQNSLLADAAYINFELNRHIDSNGNILSGSRKLFDKRGFTDKQFEIFTETYKIYTPPGGTPAHQQNTWSNFGFSATIFEHNDTGKLTVAFRGTEARLTAGIPLADFLQDIILATRPVHYGWRCDAGWRDNRLPTKKEKRQVYQYRGIIRNPAFPQMSIKPRPGRVLQAKS